MRAGKALLTSATLLFLSASSALAAEPNADALTKEFLGQSPAAERTPAQLEAAYSQVLDALLPKMGGENPAERQGPEQTLQEICWRAGRPGADAERLAVCKAIAARLAKPDLPKMARVWLIKQLEHVGRAEAVECLAGLLKDQDAQVRECARRAMQNDPAPEATAALAKDLAAATTPEWRVALINALGNRKDAAAVKPLIQQAADASDEVRAAAVHALGLIGDKAAADAIAAAMAKGSDRAKARATDAALLLADRLAAQGDKAAALGIYRKLLDAKGHLRCAAIVGIGRAGGLKELDTIFAALADPDEQVRGAGLQALGLLPAREVTQAMIAKLKAASPEMKGVLLQALARGGDKDALPAFIASVDDPSEEVRIAAIEGMGDLKDPKAASLLIPRLVKAKGKERDAARDAINRIPGPEVTKLLLAALAGADAEGRIELVRAIALHRAEPVAEPLLGVAEKDPDAPVRTEALKALADLADEKALPTLVKLLVGARDDGERQAAERAVVAVGRRVESEDERTAPVLAALPAASPAAKATLVKALGRLGGARALAAVRAALKDPSAEVQDAAFRTLPSWAEPAVAADLLAIAKDDPQLARRVLALRGAVDVIGKLGGLAAEETLKLYEAAMTAAARPEDKKMVLAGMGGVGNLGALELAMRYLDDPALRAEAATVQIARAVSGSHQAKAKEVLGKLVAASKNERVVKDARDAIDLLERFEDYVTAWQVSGPYQEGDKDGPGLFNVTFPPEKPADTTAKWRTMPIGTDRNRPWLIEFDKTPGIAAQNAAVYLRTRVYSPKAQEAQIEAGSDDGIKAWLNGKVVLSDNATRPISPGSDKAKVALNEGWNDLLVKVTQGGGEWSTCLRFRAPGGAKLEGIAADPAGK